MWSKFGLSQKNVFSLEQVRVIKIKCVYPCFAQNRYGASLSYNKKNVFLKLYVEQVSVITRNM